MCLPFLLPRGTKSSWIPHEDPWIMGLSVQQKEPRAEIQKAQFCAVETLVGVTLGKSLSSLSLDCPICQMGMVPWQRAK